MSDLGKCPDCGKLISFHFPVHDCEPNRWPKKKAKKKTTSKKAKKRDPRLCTDCETNETTVRVTATTLEGKLSDGTLLDVDELCHSCAEARGFSIGKKKNRIRSQREVTR